MNSDVQAAILAWNESASRCGWSSVRLPTSEDRERKLVKILRKYGIDGFLEVLTKAEASDFLCARTDRSEKHQHWRFSFDNAVNESFFVKIRDGNYDNRERAQPQLKSPETILWEARVRGYRAGGMWLGIWGPKPGENGCQVPPSILNHGKDLH